MFWIGLIVGVVIGLVALVVLFLWSLHVNKMDLCDYVEFCYVLGDAVENRESSMQVWHDGELINEMIFEEK